MSDFLCRLEEEAISNSLDPAGDRSRSEYKPNLGTRQMLWKLRCAVLERDWVLVRQILCSVSGLFTSEIIRSQIGNDWVGYKVGQATNRVERNVVSQTYRREFNAGLMFMWRAAFQAILILHSNESGSALFTRLKDLSTAVSVMDFSTKGKLSDGVVLELCKFLLLNKDRWDDAEQCIFGIRHSKNPGNSAELLPLVNAHEGLLKYLRWREALDDENLDEENEERLNELCSESLALLKPALDELRGDETVTFLSAIAHLEDWRDNMDEFDLIAVRIAAKQPQQSAAVAKLLKDYRRNEAFVNLLEAMTLTSKSVSESDQLWLHYVKLKLKEPEIDTKSVETLVSILTGFLDYGANTDNREAWNLLNEALSFVKDNDAQLQEEIWSYRREWWKKFHLQNDDDLLKLKKKTIKLLRKYCRKL